MQSSLVLLGLVLLLLSPCARANYRCHAFGEGVRLIESGSKYSAMCADDSYDLFYKRTGQRVQRNIAVCETDKPENGWHTAAWPGESNYYPQHFTVDSETPAEFECRKAPTPCSYHPTDNEWLTFDEATKTLTCTNSDNTLRAVKHSKGLLASLRCGRQGRSDVWKANADYEWKEAVGKYIAEASPKLNVTCEEYCVPSGDGVVVHKYGNLIEVACADPTLGLSSKGYSRVKTRCSLEKGWTEHGNTLEQSAEARMDFQCKKACVLHSTAEVLFDSSSMRYSCSNDDSHLLNLITVGDQTFDAIKCDNVDGWRSPGSKDRIDGPYTPLNASCAKYCTWSGNGIVAKRTASLLEVSCANPGYGLVDPEAPSAGLRYKSLKCNSSDTSVAWSATRRAGTKNLTANRLAHVELRCEKYRHSCDLASVEGFKYDKEAKKLTCTGDGMSAIELNSRQYSFFLCDEAEGWAARESGFDDKKPFDGSPLNGKCVEYCAVSGKGFEVYRQTDKEEVVRYSRVTCPDRGVLFYNDSLAELSDAECRVTEGWKARESKGWNRPKLEQDHTTQVQFECKPAPTTASPDNKRRIWRPSATEEPLANAEAQTLTIICASIGGIVLVIIVLIIVICVLKCQRRPDSGEIRTNNITSERSEKKDRNYNDVARSARSER